MLRAVRCVVRRPGALALQARSLSTSSLHQARSLSASSLHQARSLSTSLHQARATDAAQQHATQRDAAEKEAVKSIDEVPSPPRWPVLGSLPYMIYHRLTGKLEGRKIFRFFVGLVEAYGPVVRLESPLSPKTILISRPDDCEALIRATMNNPIRDGFESLKKIRVEAVDDYFEGKAGILPENGAEWWRVRSRVQTPMMKSSVVSCYVTLMDDVTLEFMDRMAALQQQYGEMPKDFQTEIYKWALESVGLVALNRRLGCLDPNLPADSEPMILIDLVNDIFACLNKVEIESELWKYIPTKPFRTLRAKHKEFLKIAERHILEAEAVVRGKEEGDNGDVTLMERLLLTDGLTRKDVITFILDMLFAGIDTTSHALGFTMYLLAVTPSVQSKLQQEVDAVLGDLGGPLTHQHLARLTYLKAVVKEAMRLFPLVNGVVRTLEHDMVLGGYLIPKGWMVVAFSLVMGWDEALFPRAKEFIPERWLQHRPSAPSTPTLSCPSVPGQGCVGRRIAEQEMYIFLARVMQRYNIEYHYDDMEIISRLVSTPSQPLPI